MALWKGQPLENALRRREGEQMHTPGLCPGRGAGVRCRRPFRGLVKGLHSPCGIPGTCSVVVGIPWGL